MWCISGVLVFAACTEHVTTELPAEGAAIRFDVGLSETWESGGSAPSAAPAAERPDTLAGHDAGVPTRSRSTAPNMTVTVADVIAPEEKTARPQTRATLFYGDDFPYESFGVIAYVHNTTKDEWLTYINNVEFTASSDWTAEGCNWPGFWADDIRFFAYAPYDDGDYYVKTSSYSDDAGPAITYTVPDVLDDQVDLLVAVPTPEDIESARTDGTPMDLSFKHALTAVKFNVWYDYSDGSEGGSLSNAKLQKINEIVLSGYTTGTCSYNADGEVVWTPDGNGSIEFDASDYSPTQKDGDKEGWTLEDESGYFMMIPQEASSVEVEVSYVYAQSPDADAIWCSGTLLPMMWKPGYKITYNIILPKGIDN